MHWRGGRYPLCDIPSGCCSFTEVPPPPSRTPSLCPATVPLTASAGFNGICNRQRQPPPTACPTASGAAFAVPSLLMHPWGALASACGHNTWAYRSEHNTPRSLPLGTGHRIIQCAGDWCQTAAHSPQKAGSSNPRKPVSRDKRYPGSTVPGSTAHTFCAVRATRPPDSPECTHDSGLKLSTWHVIHLTTDGGGRPATQGGGSVAR